MVGRFCLACEDLLTPLPGIKSTARKTILEGRDVHARKTGFAAYRATVDIAKMKQDPDIAWIVDQPNINLWFVILDKWRVCR